MPGTWNQQRRSSDHRHHRPAPEPSGELVAAFARPGFRGSPDGEVRISVDAFNGHPYLSVRLWEQSRDGEWIPTKKGLSVRIGEAEGVAAALLQGLAIAERDQHRRAVGPARPDQYQLQSRESRPAPARQQQPLRQQQRALPAPASPAFAPDFDEFAGA